MMANRKEAPEHLEGIRVHKTLPMKTSKCEIVEKLQVPIDEEHPVVVELMSLGYQLEQCIQAAELHSEDATAAQEYLMDMGENGDPFKDMLMESSTLQTDTDFPWEMAAAEQEESSDFTSYNERCIRLFQLLNK